MKNFLSNVLANIVAILIIGMLIFGFFITILISSALSSSKSTSIKQNSVLVLNLKDRIIENSSEQEMSIFNLKPAKELVLMDVLQSIKSAKEDKNIKGISIETDDIMAGQTQLDEIRRALVDFKKSGKFVYAYGNIMSQPAYYIASVANQFYLNPAGGIELKGMSSEVIFFKDFADKYGIGIDVIRHGKFKAAVEPFLRNDLSPENKEQITTLLNDIWSDTSTKMSTSRKLEAYKFNLAVDSLVGMNPEKSVFSGLANKLVQKSEYHDILKKMLNIKEKEDLNRISISQYMNSLDFGKGMNSGEVAVLYASGQIFNGNNFSEIHSEKYIKYIQELKDDEDVKAVVLRVNSPGGSANASDEILFELQQLKKKKPLVVSFGDYAASGGYYISMAADKIFSEPNTITGSIGVFGVVPNAKKLANNHGVTSEIVSTNANSNFYTPISGLSESSKNILQKQVEQTYKRFVYFVSQNRKKSFEEIDAIGGGRVWSGKRAKEIGLVDELGNLQDAINYAAKMAKLKDNFSTGTYPEKLDKIQQILKNFEEDEEDIAAKVIKKKIGVEQYQIFENLTQYNHRNRVQMNMPYKIIIQ